MLATCLAISKCSTFFGSFNPHNPQYRLERCYPHEETETQGSQVTRLFDQVIEWESSLMGPRTSDSSVYAPNHHTPLSAENKPKEKHKEEKTY